MLDYILDSIEAAEEEEIRRAAKANRPAFASRHEAYGVIKEEAEEAAYEHQRFNATFGLYWDAVRGDDFMGRQATLVEMNSIAEHAAAEWVQVAAMCRTALVSESEEE